MKMHRSASSTMVVLIALSICALQAEDKRLPPSGLYLPMIYPEKQLTYTVKWDPPWYLFFLPSMEAGQLILHISDPTEFQGKRANKFVVQARSSGMLSKMARMKVEDEFVYYTDPATLCTLGAAAKIQEGKRKRQSNLYYFPDERKLRFILKDVSVIPPKLLKDITKQGMPACVQDPISALYSYRAMNLDIGHTRIFTIGNDDKIKEVRTHVEKMEHIVIPAGNFYSWKVKVDALKGGLFKEGGDFWIWLAEESKMPVQFEAKVGLGRVLGVLKSSAP